MPPFVDLTGQRFGKLVVINRAGTRNREALWRCRCDCGNETLSRGGGLRGGKVRSCGCTRIEKVRKNPPRKTHGGRKDRLYKVWRGIHDRCTYPSHNRYKDYGGRGITMCDEWKEYENFRTWAVENGYDPEAPRGVCTIDRIDVDGNYCPENCRWVSMEVQAQNKRRNE